MTIPFKKAVYSCPVDHDGTTIFIQGWITSEDHLPPIVLVHDVYQSGSSLTKFAEMLSGNGFSTYSYDLRGHGDSNGKSGHIEDFNTLVRDLLQVVAWIRYVHAGKSPTIICQGMGCIVGLFFARGFHQYASGLVLASPMVQFSRPIGAYRRLGLKTLADFFPKWYCPPFLCPQISASGKGQKIRLTNSSVFELLNTMFRTKKILSRVPLRSLLLVPENTRNYQYEGLKRAIAKNKHSKAISIVNIPTSSNNVLNDYVCANENNMQFLVDWLLCCELPKQKKSVSISQKNKTSKGSSSSSNTEETSQ